jgi:exopolyphosphatase/guanosine-5'-triphosphate,3'-diphosphate pyrophosphatase
MNSPNAQRRAVIDVGTNSVKLLVADVAGGNVAPVVEESRQTRLGAGFYAAHRLQPGAVAGTARAVAKFAARAEELGAASIRIIATSAARDAANAEELVKSIRAESGLGLEILSGHEEADWAFRGAASNPKLAHGALLVVDVGGGSTEFIVGENSTPKFWASHALGTVRLLEELNPGDPPGLDALARCRKFLKDFLRKNVAPALAPALRQCSSQPQLVGTSGTAAILARMEAGTVDYDRGQMEATSLSIGRIGQLLEQQWSLPLSERRKIPGLPPDRADVMSTGVAIFEAIMVEFAFPRLHISTRGLRYWALLQS